MKITKYGHACILAEINGVHILVDPGNWNAMPDADSIDAILITHEHADHFDLPQVKELIAKHPKVKIITHDAVGKMLADEGIAYELIAPGESIDVNGVSIESFGTEHAEIYGGVSPCKNTGFLVGGELFVTGDALHDVPSKQVRVLALPTGGPWMRISEAIDYAKKINPVVVFPVHDAMYTTEYRDGFIPRVIGGNLDSAGIKFVDVKIGIPQEM